MNAGSLRHRYLYVLLLTLLFPALAEAQYSGVMITEIMYHPSGEGGDLEYIELHNPTPHPVDLSGWFFSRGISYVFGEGVWLDGGRYLVVAANSDRLREVYSINNVVGDWGVNCDGDGGRGCSLSNGGEVIELSQQVGVAMTRVRYNDRGGWPAAADGTGHSLEMSSPYLEQDDPDSWQASTAIGGSPGRANTPRVESPIVINEALLWTDGERWVEFYNQHPSEEADLSGMYLTTDRENLRAAIIPEGSVIPPLGRIAFVDTDLGLDFTPVAGVRDENDEELPQARTFIALVETDGEDNFVIDAYLFEPVSIEKSEARIPDGDEDRSDFANPTRGTPNEVSVETEVVINEVLYHPIDNDVSNEFLEIYNRSDRRIDLSGWRFSRGVNYAFPDGQMIDPGAYLVIAKNPERIVEVYSLPEEQVLGPRPDDFDAIDDFGMLRDDGERINLRDASGNLADSVRFHDGGQWPRWADGGGSSMELIDPFQNNNVASSWDSSDDSGKSEVVTHAYTGAYVTGQPELHLLLAHRGITLVDDLKLVQRTITVEPLDTFVANGDEWAYFKGVEEASEPREAWRELDFDDSGWERGATIIGYGEDDETTLLSDMRQKSDDEDTPDIDESQPGYLTVFLRKTFEVTDPSTIENLIFEVEYDDGMVAYLNGTRISVENMRDDVEYTFDTRARSNRENVHISIDLTDRADLLNAGTNILAVQFHNASITGSDSRFTGSLVNGRFVNSDGPNQVTNGEFEQNLRAGLAVGGWQIQGTHMRSGRTTVDPISGKASLKLVASAKGDNKVNRLELTLPALQSRSNYTMEFKSRWVVGAPTLLSHGHNLASAAFDYPKSHRLGVPRNLGTPGEINSVTARQIDRTGDANIGPVISKIQQTPSVPVAGQAVEIVAKVEDTDGVDGVKLLYWLEDTRGLPGSDETQEIAMTGPDHRNRYRASIPGSGNRTRVVFRIEATDTSGAAGRYPLDEPTRTHPVMLDPENPQPVELSHLVYRHDVAARPRNPRWHSYRFYMSHAQETQMARQRRQSNFRYEGSFVFQDRDIYHNARTRFSGSPWARGGFGGSYRVYMAKDGPLHGTMKRFNMEDHQGGADAVNERLSNYLFRHNMGNIVVPHAFQWLVQWQMNDKINTAREHLMSPSSQYIDYWLSGDDNGHLYEVDDRFEINDSGNRQNSIDARWTYPPMRSGDGEDKENYRFFFNVRMNKGWDDYTHLIESAKIMDSRITPDAVFDEVVWDHFDVEQMLRVWAIRMNTDDWDTWGTNRGKNSYLYRRPSDGRWMLLPWDMELTYGNAGAFMPPPITQNYTTINGGKFPEVVRMINRPRIKRMYYGIMNEMVQHQFRSSFLAPYRAKLAQLSLRNLQHMSPNGFIDQRNRSLSNVLRTAVSPQVSLAITTNGGDDFSTQNPVIVLSGRAPVDISNIVILVNDTDPGLPVNVEFSNSNVFAWSASIALSSGANGISVFGFDTSGELIDSTDVEVTADFATPAISEIQPGTLMRGETMTIIGTGLFDRIPVTLGGVALEGVDYSGLPDSIAVELPMDIGSGSMDVRVGIAGQESEPFAIEIISETGRFVRGDTDLSGSLSISDTMVILFYLWNGGAMPCLDAADVDDSGLINLTDPIFLLNSLFQGGPAPGAPFPAAGEDPSEDKLDCEAGL